MTVPAGDFEGCVCFAMRSETNVGLSGSCGHVVYILNTSLLVEYDGRCFDVHDIHPFIANDISSNCTEVLCDDELLSLDDASLSVQ